MKAVIVGCGIVGLAIAHAISDEGHQVTIIDRDGPAAGASRGNAGWLAHTDIMPIASPRVWRQLPQFLRDPLGPLSIRRSYLPRLLPWLVRFAIASRPAARVRSMEALAALQIYALPAWAALAEQLSLTAMIQRRGGLYIFDSSSNFEAAKPVYQRQRALGMRVDFLAAVEIAALEPALATDKIAAAAFFPDSAHVADPLHLTQALFQAARQRGIHFLRAEVDRLIAARSLRIVCKDAGSLEADLIVIAAGAWSKPLAAQLGDAVPLETERGYNVSFPAATRLLSRPVSLEGHGFVITPLATGLRVGGGVEFGGLHSPADHRRTQALYTKATRFVRGLPGFDAGTLWMGLRPSLPDSLPVIGPSRLSDKIIYAFGHGHYGLTQAAFTAQLVADLVGRRPTRINLAPYSAQRF